MRQLVSTEWLEKNINKVKILDATWCLPNSGRNAEEEFKENHIKNSIFFDIDKNSKKNSSLPHMLPSNTEWEKIVSNLGINNSDHVIIYDNSDVFSSCRVWYSFIYFGHDPDLVSVLDGNFTKWLKEKRFVSKECTLCTDGSLMSKNKCSNTPKVESVVKEEAPVMVHRDKHLCSDSEGIRRTIHQMVMMLGLVIGNKIRCRIIKLRCGAKAVIQYYG